jgi:hypothetical protein
MSYKMKPLSILLFTVFALLSLQPPTIPPTTDPSHKGQPAWCQNYNTSMGAHNCDCMAMHEKGDSCKREGEYGPDTYGENGMPRCSTHCRRDACQCEGNCTS